MPTIQDVLANYQELCRFCDGFWDKVLARHPQDLQCKKGCCYCCGLESVSAIEAYSIRGYLNKESTLPEGAPSASSTSEMCSFLSNGLCLIYQVRPLICRTHGLPISSASLTGNTIDCCPLNFNHMKLQNIEPDCVLDVDMITDNLIQLNMAFCMLLGDSELASERFSLQNIRENNLPDLLKAEKAA